MIEKITFISSVLTDETRKLSHEFFTSCKFPGKYNHQGLVDRLNSILRSGTGALWVMRSGGEVVGVLFAILAPCLVTGRTMAMESIWYVVPEHRRSGLLLFKEFEDWAKKVGASIMMTGHKVSTDQRFESFLEGRGYTPFEVYHYKELCQ